MAFHQKAFLAQTGLQLDNASKIFHGEYRGYPVFLHWEVQKGYLVFMTHGVLAEPRDLTQTLTQWQVERTGVSNLTYTGNSLIGMITFSPKMTDENAVDNLSALVELARQIGLQPSCVECGMTTGFDKYIINGKGYTFCSGCAARVGEALAAQKATKSEQPAKPLGVLIGTVCGGLLLFLLTYIIWQAGYVAYITGYVGALVTFLLIKKLAGKLSVSAAIIGGVVCLLVAFFTPCFCMANDMAQSFSDSVHEVKEYQEIYPQLREALDTLSDDELESAFGGSTRVELEDAYQEGMETIDLVLNHTTAWECFRDMPTILAKEEDGLFDGARAELIKNILWGVLSIIIGMGLTAPAMLREGAGSYSVRRLES